MMCRCLCLVLLAIAQGLREGRLELELEPSPLEELRRNASSESWEDRENVAKSSELAELVRRNSTEAVEILRNLTRVKYFEVKIGVAESSALKALVETRPEEGAQLVKDLVKDEDFSVRVAVAASPALETLVEQRPKEGFQMVMLLLESDRDLRMHRAAYEWWPAFEQYATPFANDFNSSLHGSWEEKVSVARNSSWRAVLNLNWEDGKRLFTTLIQDADPDVRSAAIDSPAWNMLFRYDVAEGIHFFKKLSRSILDDAVKAEKNANTMIFVWAAIWGAFFKFLSWIYPRFCTWREERKIVGEAKDFLREAEAFQIVASLQPIPKPLADLTILKRPDVFNNPYLLYRYKCLKPALREAFRLGRLYMDHGLKTWDFSKVVQSSGAASQELATRNYSMAREFLDNQESAPLSNLMLTCDEIQRNCDPYSSDLESISDAVEACYQMYKQAFVAKRAYFDAMVKKIGQTTGAEARFCAEKGLLRLAEKHCLRPKSGIIWDGIRAMLVGTSLDQLSEALHGLQAEQKAGRLKIIQINNRFAKPTQDNWQDIAVYVMFNDSRFSGIVGEIQLVHETFLAVRTHFKAHDAYDGIRFAAEAYKRKNKDQEIRGLPDSQRSNPAP